MKNKPTELTVTIIGDYTHEPPATAFEAKIQPIEKAAFSLLTFFNFIKTSASFYEGEAGLASYELGAFCGDLITLSEIGFATGKSILKSSSELFDFQLKPAAPEKIEAVTQTSEPLASLAAQLSAFLNDENLPVGIYNRLMSAIDDIENEADSDELHRAGTSPEYLKAVFSAYERNQSETTSDD